MTAYHEAGHAVVQTLLEHADPVHKVSIIPRGESLGATFSLPEKNRVTFNRKFTEATLRVLCAGRIAEAVLGDDTNSGAASDIKQATGIARTMVTEWGMSDKLGFVNYGDDHSPGRMMMELPGTREFSEETAKLIDLETKKIIDAAYADAGRMISENRDKLETVAQALLKYETIDGEDIKRLMDGEILDKPTVADLISAEQDRRDAEKPTPVARPVQPPQSPGEIGPIPEPA